MKKNKPCLILFTFIALFNHFCFAQEREIAITIDDLPFVGTNSYDDSNLNRCQTRFMQIVQSLVDNQVPATGFVIAGAIGKGQWKLLEEFRKDGFDLGNHTYSHANLNQLTADKYINEIARADKILSPIMTQPKYFRYPYLAEGKGVIKNQVQDYLTSNQYVVAPVTIDSKDYLFNERLLHISWRERSQHLGEIKRKYLNYIWNQTLIAEKSAKDNNKKQILLVHANLLNSHFLGDVIQMYKKNGYRFISLNEALTNTASPTTNTLPTPTISAQNNVSNALPTQQYPISTTPLKSEWLPNLESEW